MIPERGYGRQVCELKIDYLRQLIAPLAIAWIVKELAFSALPRFTGLAHAFIAVVGWSAPRVQHHLTIPAGVIVFVIPEIQVPHVNRWHLVSDVESAIALDSFSGLFRRPDFRPVATHERHCLFVDPFDAGLHKVGVPSGVNLRAACQFDEFRGGVRTVDGKERNVLHRQKRVGGYQKVFHPDGLRTPSVCVPKYRGGESRAESPSEN